jgi:hypothetical protein
VGEAKLLVRKGKVYLYLSASLDEEPTLGANMR